jgi:hypothetical protein
MSKRVPPPTAEQVIERLLEFVLETYCRLDWHEGVRGQLLHELRQLDAEFFAACRVANLPPPDVPDPANDPDALPQQRLWGSCKIPVQEKDGGLILWPYKEWDQAMQRLLALARRVPPGRLEDPPDRAPATPVGNAGVLVLGALLKHYPALRTVPQISEDLGIQLSDRTIARELPKLIGAGLAERPQGPRNGATLTPKGKALAERLAPKPPPVR